MVEPEKMYKAKMCMDTVIVRLGDTVAAGLFHVLEGFLHAGKPPRPISSLSLLSVFQLWEGLRIYSQPAYCIP